MSEGPARYDLAITPTARRQLSENLPEAVAAAAYEFIAGPMPDNPQRVGKQLRPPLEDRDSAPEARTGSSAASTRTRAR